MIISFHSAFSGCTLTIKCPFQIIKLKQKFQVNIWQKATILIIENTQVAEVCLELFNLQKHLRKPTPHKN